MNRHLHAAGLPLRSSTASRPAICFAARKPAALGAPQVLDDVADPPVAATDTISTPSGHALPRLDASTAERQASHGGASTSAPPPVRKPGRGRPPKQAVPNNGNPPAAASTADNPATAASTPTPAPRPTETVFIGEVPGFGWSEGFMPTFRTEQRPIEPIKKRRGRKKKSELAAEAVAPQTDDDVEEAPEELEIYLVELGVPQEKVRELMDTAVAWRVTPGGRPLIDRRRQSRLARNVRIVAEYLRTECGVSHGPDGVAAVFQHVPELMLCKPTSNDRWDRRAVELAAFRLRHGHCNVPEAWEPNMELGTWVKRQRVARAAGQLSEERLQILERMGFEFGDLAQITEEWEMRFDQLIDWMLWHGENGQTFSWAGVDWGARGGVTARELALWMALQREFRRRQLLPAEAEQRFEALQVTWEGGEETAAAEAWMGWLGRLLYVVERRCLESLRPPTKLFGKRADDPSNESSDEEEAAAAAAAAATAAPQRRRSGPPSPGRNMKARLAATVAARREALVEASPAEEPGLGVWIARQRWLWRRGNLPAEQTRMLHLAGVDMDLYPATEWQAIAHDAAEALQGCCIEMGCTTGARQPPTPSAPAAEAAEEAEEESPSPPSSSSTATEEEGEASAASAAPAVAAAPRAQGNRRLRLLRWVETQRALFAEGRLSPGQLRYLQFLGISWILSDEVVAMDDEAWSERLAQQAAERRKGTVSAALIEWLDHQRGLHALGMLPPARRAAIEAAAVGWEFERPADAAAWDLRLSQLLVQSMAVGNTDVTPENERFEGLREWLTEARGAAAAGRLPSSRAAQLKALGVNLPDFGAY